MPRCAGDGPCALVSIPALWQRRLPARVFAIVVLALPMMPVDSTILATAPHGVRHGLGTTIDGAGRTITAYSLGFALRCVPLA